MVELQCSRVWGGIKNEDIDASSQCMTASLYSSACSGGRGGDIYYLSVCSADKVTRLAIADVVGHGEKVSTVAQWLYESLQARMNGLDGREVLQDLNGMTVDQGLDALTTVAVVTLYPAGKQAHFAYAGHPPTLMRQRDGGRWLEVPVHDQTEAVANLPLGVDLDVVYHERVVPIQGGDRLLLYTDGVIETADNHGELFGRDRLTQALDQADGASLYDVKKMIIDRLEHFAAGKLAHDDLTLMAVEVK